MKKLIICIQDFKQGGIPRCLQSLLKEIDTSKYQVDLYCLNHEGPYQNDMPNCNILAEDRFIKALTVFSKNISISNAHKYLTDITCKIIRKFFLLITKKDLMILKLKRIAKNISTRNAYDIAIAYSEGYPSIFIENVKCKNKAIWIHNDYAHQGARSGVALTNFEEYNHICCVSNATKKSFLTFFSNLSPRISTIYNIVNYDYIIELSKKKIEDKRFKEFEGFKVVSIGRVCAQKNFTCIPQIMSKIKGNAKWFIIGDGPENEVKIIEEEIKKYKMKDKVIMLGGKENPYCYLANSNLFVLTSIYESYPTVINEAKVLNIPIISNDIPPAHEMMPELDNFNSITTIENMAELIDKVMCKKCQNIGLNVENPFLKHNKSVMNDFYKIVNNL